MKEVWTDLKKEDKRVWIYLFLIVGVALSAYPVEYFFGISPGVYGELLGTLFILWLIWWWGRKVHKKVFHTN